MTTVKSLEIEKWIRQLFLDEVVCGRGLKCLRKKAIYKLPYSRTP